MQYMLGERFLMLLFVFHVIQKTKIGYLDIFRKRNRIYTICLCDKDPTRCVKSSETPNEHSAHLSLRA